MKIHKQQNLNTAYNKAFKFRFYPDSEQVSLLNHFFGSARFVFNQTLSYSINHYKSKEYLITDDYGDLITINNDNFNPLSSTDRINYIKELKLNNPWLHEVSSIVLQQSIINLNNAYNNFFRKCKNSSIKQKGYPQFKKKHHRQSFRIVGKNSIHFNQDGSFTLPKFDKPLDIRFSRTFDRDKVSSVTITKEPNGHYYISFLSQDNYKRCSSINNKIAFDSGIKTNISTYDGNKHQGFNLPDLKHLLKKIKLNQRQLSRKVKGSNNRNKQRIKLARLYAYKENKVNDFYHKLTSTIVNENQMIVVEDLNFNSMKSIDSNNKYQGKNIRKNLQQISLSKIYNFIEYKAKWYGKTLIYADKYYPSSKKCSTLNCNYINHELSLSDRTWKCPQCKNVHDRDENAALNLYDYNEDNAKKVIKDVLLYHKNKIKNNILVENKKSTKLKLDNKLLFSKTNKTQAKE
jgi:putative transposase